MATTPVAHASGSLSSSRSRPSNLPSEQRRHSSKIGQILLSSTSSNRSDDEWGINWLLLVFVTAHVVLGQSFPTPMEEPRKVLKAQYVGSTQVRRPSGMETLNDAIDQMVSQVPTDQWREVNVAVAPSVVTVTDAEVRVPKSFPSSSSSFNDFCYRQKDEEKIIVESRVRFLSFLGIGRQVEHCGFIVHTANDVYIAHVLYCHPSSGAICKTIEAACKVT